LYRCSLLQGNSNAASAAARANANLTAVGEIQRTLSATHHTGAGMPLSSLVWITFHR